MADKVEAKSDLKEVIATFTRDLDSLSQMLDTSMVMLSAANKGGESHFEEFAARYGEKIEGEEGETSYRFPRDYAAQAARIIRQQERTVRGFVLLPRSFIVSLISSFDAYVGGLLTAIYTKRPEFLDASERSLSLAELKSFGSIDAAVDFLISKEIESLLRQSHPEQFASMEKRFNIKLREGLDSWPRFVELTQRRNCLVHSGGAASEQYFKVCREHGSALESGLSVGDILDVDPSYFESAHSCLFEIGVKLGQVLWRKLIPSEIEAADSSLISTIFDLLSEKRWALAANLADFSCVTLKRHSSEQNRRICLVNRAQAYKWLGESKKCLEILDSEDWSASSDDFRLAAQVLRDDYSSALVTMRRIGGGGGIPEEAYTSWPLFRKFRKEEEFLEAYESIFGKPFVDVESVWSAERREKTQKRLEQVRKIWEDDAEAESGIDLPLQATEGSTSPISLSLASGDDTEASPANRPEMHNDSSDSGAQPDIDS